MPCSNKTCDMELHVTLLGEFRIQLGETAVSTITTPSHQSLFAYLIVNRDKIFSRQQLAFQIWPDSTEVQARTNLRKAIYHLRQKLPLSDKLLRVERHVIQWLPDAPVSADVTEFETAVSQAKQAPALPEKKEHLQNAIDCYQGEFLPGHYEEWVLAARETMHQQYLSCLELLIELLTSEEDFSSAVPIAQQLLRADPLHEEAYRRLMRLQAQNGRVAAALRTYHTCNTTLQNELGVSPSAATQALYEQLLQTNDTPAAQLPMRIPLVARSEAWHTLLNEWHQACQQGPRMVLIQGEAGIGKTRLAEELLLWAERQGINTAVSSCYAAQGRLPYAPITQWLRSEVIQKVVYRMHDKWQVEIARLLPNLLAKRPSLSSPSPLTEGWQRQHFFTALARTILQVRQPFLLCIDDLQWADQDSLEWLHFLLQFDAEARFLLVGTVRNEEVDETHPWNRLQQQLLRENYLQEITLMRLTAAETGSLANHVLPQKLDESEAAWLYAETEGIPLFAVEMARMGLHHWRENQPRTVAGLPSRVRSVLESRLNQLSPAARNLAELAAVIGSSFTFDLLAAASTQKEETLVAGLDELWQRHIVREQGGDAYDFSHGKLRQAAYERLSNARRRLLHRGVVEALELGCNDTLEEIRHQLAAHYEAMGNDADAIEQYQQAAAVAERIFAHQETLVHLEKALSLLPNVDADGETWAVLHSKKASVLAMMGNYVEAREVLETAVSHDASPIFQARLLCQKAGTWSAQQQQEAALAAYDQALAILNAESADHNLEWRQIWIDVQLGRSGTFYFLSRLTELASLIEQLQHPITTYGIPEQRRRFLESRNMLSFRQKRYRLNASDVQTCEEILAIAQSLDDVHKVTASYFGLGFANAWSGNPKVGVSYLERARQQASETGNMYLHDQALAYLTQAYRMQGDVAKVKALVTQHEAVSAQSNNPFYNGMLAGQRAWLGFYRGDLETAVSHGKLALQRWQGLPFPLQWIAYWPLLATALMQSRLADAIEFAVQMLHPSQQLLDEAVTFELQQAICAWEGGERPFVKLTLQTLSGSPKSLTPSNYLTFLLN